MALKKTRTIIASYADIELVEVYIHDMETTAYLVINRDACDGYDNLKDAVVNFGIAVNRKHESYIEKLQAVLTAITNN